MKASFIAKKAEIVNKLSRELLEVNKQIAIQRPQKAAKAISFINEKTSALFARVAEAKSEEDLNNAWLDYTIVMSGYIVANDILIDID